MSLIRKVVGPLVSTAVGANAGTLDIGQEIPDVTSYTHDGKEIHLKEFRKEPYTLVYFYPKADTPGCTKQACSLRDAFSGLSEKGVTILGVSKDSVKDQKAFADKYKLPFLLLADMDSVVVKAFGVPTFPGIGIPKRQAFLFKGGKLIWRDLSASTEKQAQDVLEHLD